MICLIDHGLAAVALSLAHRCPRGSSCRNIRADYLCVVLPWCHVVPVFCISYATCMEWNGMQPSMYGSIRFQMKIVLSVRCVPPGSCLQTAPRASTAPLAPTRRATASSASPVLQEPFAPLLEPPLWMTATVSCTCCEVICGARAASLYDPLCLY